MEPYESICLIFLCVVLSIYIICSIIDCIKFFTKTPRHISNKIYLLTRKDDVFYGEQSAMVIRACNEERARSIAFSNHGDENNQVWTDKDKVEVTLLSGFKLEKLILKQYSEE